MAIVGATLANARLSSSVLKGPHLTEHYWSELSLQKLQIYFLLRDCGCYYLSMRSQLQRLQEANSPTPDQSGVRLLRTASNDDFDTTHFAY